MPPVAGAGGGTRRGGGNGTSVAALGADDAGRSGTTCSQVNLRIAGLSRLGSGSSSTTAKVPERQQLARRFDGRERVSPGPEPRGLGQASTEVEAEVLRVKRARQHRRHRRARRHRPGLARQFLVRHLPCIGTSRRGLSGREIAWGTPTLSRRLAPIVGGTSVVELRRRSRRRRAWWCRRGCDLRRRRAAAGA